MIVSLKKIHDLTCLSYRISYRTRQNVGFECQVFAITPCQLQTSHTPHNTNHQSPGRVNPMHNATAKTAIPLTVDCMWHCLSPAFSTRSSSAIRRRPWVWSTPIATKSVHRPSSQVRRCLSTTAARTTELEATSEASPLDALATDRDRRHWQKVETRRQQSYADWEQQIQREQKSWKEISGEDAAAAYDLGHGLSTGGFRSKEELMAMLESNTTEAIYQRMRFAARRGETVNVQRIAAYLTKERGEQPNLRLYGNLILSHVSAPAGSALWVAAYLKELKGEGLEADSGACHDVLKVSLIIFSSLARVSLTSVGFGYSPSLYPPQRSVKLHALEVVHTLHGRIS